MTGAENSSTVSVGQTAQWGLNSVNKTNQCNQLLGDFGNAPLLYSAILDNDLYDSPVVDLWPY